MNKWKSKFDVLWLINGTEGFGISRATQSLANEIRKRGKSLLFVSFQNGILVDSLKSQGFEVSNLNLDSIITYKGETSHFFKSLYKNINFLTGTSKKLKKQIAHFEYKVLLYRSPNLTPFAYGLPNKNVIKVFLMPNVIGDTYFLNLNKHLYLLAAVFGKINIIGNSRYTAATLSGWGIKPDVLYLGVDSEDFKPDNRILERRNHKINENDIVYGVFARFNETKAQDLVIRAFHKLVLKYPNEKFKLLLIGAGKEDDYLRKCKKLINDLNFTDQVILLDTKSDIIPYYSLVDVMINSRRDAEPFGLTIIESMLMKKPIIALGLGGPSETIINNETGWLVSHPTVESYFEKMELALQQKENWNKMGDRGRKHALRNFTTETFYKNFWEKIEKYQNQKPIGN